MMLESENHTKREPVMQRAGFMNIRFSYLGCIYLAML